MHIVLNLSMAEISETADLIGSCVSCDTRAWKLVTRHAGTNKINLRESTLEKSYFWSNHSFFPYVTNKEVKLQNKM